MNEPRMVGLRVYLCVSGAVSATAGYVNQSTESAYLWAFALLLGFSLLGLADTVVNDILGNRWLMPSVEKRRHDGYLTLAAANLAFVFVAVRQDHESVALLRYVLDAAMCAYVAFNDVKLRFIDPKKESQSHAHAHLR